MNWLQFLERAEEALELMVIPVPGSASTSSGADDAHSQYLSILLRFSRSARELHELRDEMTEEQANLLFREALPSLLAGIGEIFLQAQHVRPRNALLLPKNAALWGGMPGVSLDSGLRALQELQEKMQRTRRINRESASKPRKSQEKEEEVLAEFRKYVIQYRDERGVLSHLQRTSGWDPKTIIRVVGDRDTRRQRMKMILKAMED